MRRREIRGRWMEKERDKMKTDREEDMETDREEDMEIDRG